MRDKWRRFCEEYLLDLDAAAAYRRAGYKCTNDYSAWNAASRLLARVEVQQYISTLMYERSQRTEIAADAVIEELSHIAFSRFTDVVEFNSAGIQLRDSGSLTESAVAAIEEVSQVEARGVVTVRVKLASKVSALRLLAQHFGLLTDLNVAIATCIRYGLKVSSDLKQFDELANSTSHLREDSDSFQQIESSLEIPGESWGSD